MKVLSHGVYKPEAGDTGDVFFPRMEDNMQHLNDHTHNGVDSPYIATQTASSKINLFSPPVVGATVDQSDPYFGVSLKFSEGANQVAGGFLKLFNKFEKLSVPVGKIILPVYVNAIDDFFKFELVTVLLKNGVAISSTTNQSTYSKEVGLSNVLNQLIQVDIDFTDSDGKINGFLIEKGDSLKFSLTRVTSSGTDTIQDVVVKKDEIEVLL